MSEPPTFQHLGIFSDLVDHIGAVGTAKESGLLTGDLRKRIRNLLSVEPDPRSRKMFGSKEPGYTTVYAVKKSLGSRVSGPEQLGG